MTIKKHNILLALLSLTMFCSCAKDMDHMAWPADPGEDDTPIVFLRDTDYEAWTHIGGLEERFAACEIPAEVLNAKTTRALGLSILHYPLNGIIFAYNFWDMPVKMIYDKSPLHQALAVRKDAAEVLIDIFDKTSIDPDIIVSQDYQIISLFDELFLEFFLGTKLVRGLDSNANRKKLSAIVSRKLKERSSDDSSINVSLIALAYMNERLGLGLKFDDDIVDTMHHFTLGDGIFDYNYR